MSLVQIHTGPGFLGAAADAGDAAAHRAHVMLRLARRDMDAVERRLAEVAGLTALHQITGEYDLVAIVEAAHAEALDDLIDRISGLSGVRAATASRLLPTLRSSNARSFAA